MLTGFLPIELNIKILGYLSFLDLLNLYYNANWISSSFKEEIHLTLVKRCRGSNPPWIEWLTFKIFLEGNLDALRWLHDLNTQVSYSDISSISAHNGYLNILIWMTSKGLFINDDIIEMCVIGDQPEVLKWISHYDRVKVLNLATERCSLKILEFLHIA